MNTKKTVVISAVNFTEGGPLTVLRESLASAVEVLPAHWNIIALVNSTNLISLPRVKLIAVPDAKVSWFRRLYWEWLGFYKLSLALQPDMWLSLHDITPRVKSKSQAVYCHNPSPFYSMKIREVWHEPKLLLFCLLYSFVYRLRIKTNKFVIVQQAWLRLEFTKRFGSLPAVVAYPSRDVSPRHGVLKSGRGYVFLYPALARVFKNFEVICEAVRIVQSRGVDNFEVRITIDGSENRYARWLSRHYSHLKNLKFIGRQSRVQMNDQYLEATAVLFPSRLETWGLPITEAKQNGLPVLAADLPYAHETVGEYDLVSFFDPDSPEALANLMLAMIGGTWHPSGCNQIQPAAPFAEHWGELWKLLINSQDSSGSDKYQA